MQEKSNLSLISNVYKRKDVSLKLDPVFQQKVHGRDALLRLLREIDDGSGVHASAFRFLTPEQRAELDQQTRCAVCHAYPIGPVRSNGHTEIVFRCPRQHCERAQGRGRAVRLSRSVVEAITVKLQLPLREAVTLVLGTQIEPAAANYTQRADAALFSVWLSWTQYYHLSDRDIEAELVRVLEEH